MMLRTASSLVACTPYQRTAAGLVECSALFFGQSGPVDVGSPPAVTATASPDYVSGAIDSPSARAVTTNATTVTVAGGTSPYSYAWSTGDPATAIVAPTSASTAFRSMVGPGDSYGDTAVCTVTDAKGKTATSNPVSLTFSNYNNKVLN